MTYEIMKLNYREDYKEIGDAMRYDSPFEFLNAILKREDGAVFDVTIGVEGYVSVFYKGEHYTHFSEMPKELQQKFIDYSAFQEDGRDLVIDENNWWEVYITKNGECCECTTMEFDPCDFNGEEDMTNYIERLCNRY